MKVAVFVPLVKDELAHNLREINNAITEAAKSGADLLILPEACLTGLPECEDPAQDILLAHEADGPVLQGIKRLCRESRIDLAFGFIEKSGGDLYDSAMLYDSRRDAAHVYRRVSRGWYGTPNSIYKCGEKTTSFDYRERKVSFLICGDLFDDALARAVAGSDADLVFVPLARCFPKGTDIVREWQAEERRVYIDQLAKLGKEAIMVNYLSPESDERYFGGALHIDVAGRVKNEIGVVRREMLVFEI